MKNQVFTVDQVVEIIKSDSSHRDSHVVNAIVVGDTNYVEIHDADRSAIHSPLLTFVSAFAEGLSLGFWVEYDKAIEGCKITISLR